MKHRPKRGLYIALILALALVSSLAWWGPALASQRAPSGLDAAASSAAQASAVARMMLFYSDSCPSCQSLLNDFMPTIKSQYGAKVEILYFEISDPANMQMLVALEEAYGVPSDRATIPEIFMGNDVFLGADVVRQDLATTIDSYLAKGGVDFTAPMQQVLADRQPTQGGIVHAVMFYLSTCSHCHEIINTYLPVLEQRYGDQLEIHLLNVDSDPHYAEFMSYIRPLVAQDTQLGVPTLVIGTHVMIGTYEIEGQAESIIQGYLAQGGVDYPADVPSDITGPIFELGMTAETLPTGTVVTPETTPTAPATPLPVINLAYFQQAGCQECDSVKLALNYMKSRFPELVVTTFDSTEYAALNEWMGEQTGVPENKRMTAPAVYVGDKYLVGSDITVDSLETLIAPYQTTGATKLWDNYQGDKAKTSVLERFRSLGALTVVGAGLIDGLNPCAFATLVFFISYLALSGRKGRDLLAVGLAFTVAVFLTYLAVGLGLRQVLASLSFLGTVGRWVYGLTALLCIVLAVVSISDYIKARRGQAGDMALSLPKALRKRINALVRNAQGMRAFVGIAFVTGIAISLIELACTGQVYLPTIIFVLSVPELKVKAFLYLLLYNVFFVVPLAIVFVLAYYGTTGNQLGIFLRKRTATIKLLTAVLFVALAAWLVYGLAF